LGLINIIKVFRPIVSMTNKLEGTIMSILLDEDRLKDIPPPLKINPNDTLMNK